MAKIDPSWLIHNQPKEEQVNTQDQFEDFKQWALSVSGVYPSKNDLDDEYYRYTDPKKQKKNEDISIRCKVTPGGLVYGDVTLFWRGEKYEYKPFNGSKPLTPDQVQDLEADAIRRKEEQDKRHEASSQQTVEYLQTLQKNIGDDHPYIGRKRIKAYGDAYRDAQNIVVPLTDFHGKVWSTQTISTDGFKKFRTGAKTAGTHFRIDGHIGKVIVCEGWATGCTLRELTKATVFCAMTSGQLMNTVKGIIDNQGVSPKDIVICSDNDYIKDDNVGLKTAERVSEKTGCLMLAPQFNGIPGSDWNDLYCEAGADEAKRQLSVYFREEKEVEKPITLHRLAGKTSQEQPPRRWIIKNRLLSEAITMTVAPGGFGKSTFAMAEGLCISDGKSVFKSCGMEVIEKGPVLYCGLEEPYQELTRKLVGMREYYDIQSDDFMYFSGMDYPLVIAKDNETEIVEGPGLAFIKDVIEKENPVLIIIDPWVEANEISENDNKKMVAAMHKLGQLVVDTRTAIHLVHHTVKGNDVEKMRGNADMSRGASGQVNKARIVHTLTGMTAEEGMAYGVKEHFRYFRIDDGKLNYGLKDGKGKWFKNLSIGLGNAREIDGIYREEDSIGVPQPASEVLELQAEAEDKKIDKISQKEMVKSRAIDWLESILKAKGSLCYDELFGLIQNPMAHGGVEKELYPTHETIEFWGEKENYFKQKLGKIIDENPRVFGTETKNRRKYIFVFSSFRKQ